MFIVLTKSDTFLIGPIADILGIIMNWLFEFTSSFGVTNIGLAIILFTIVVKLLMFPLTWKQQKTSKLQVIMQPEIQDIQRRYKDKKDQDSMLRMNEETKAVYAKYGTSMTGGCLPLLIQLPLMYALYRVIYNIPAYVASIKEMFMAVVTPLMAQSGYQDILNASFVSFHPGKYDLGNANSIIDLLYKFTGNDWSSLSNEFSSISDIITSNAERIMHINDFVGINLTEAPGFALTPALAIPILAGVTQWISTKMISGMQPQQANPSEETSGVGSYMKVMTNMMPLLSAFFCISMPAALGVYWIASSVVQIIQQLILNIYFDHTDMEKLIEKSVEKANKKRAKKGLPEQKISKATMTVAKNIDTKTYEEQKAQKQAELENRLKKMQEATDYYNKGLAKPGSLSAKANMVKQYNEKKDRKK